MKSITLLLQGLLIFGLILFSVGCEDDPASILDLPQIELSVAALDFGSSDVAKTFTISNSGLGTLTWTLSDDADWLTANPSSGSNLTSEMNTITITANRAGLDAGSYTAEITITDDDHELEGTVNVTMVVDAPTLSVSIDDFDFGIEDTTTTFNIANLGAGTITWNIAVDMNWLAVTPISGSTTIGADDIITINVDRAMASPGMNGGMITVSSDAGDETIAVTLTSGTMIWNYDVTDMANFNDGWEVWDDVDGSGGDYWGVVNGAGRNDDNAVWCAAQGDHVDGQYDNEMDASMVIWPQNAINIGSSDFRVHLPNLGY